MFFPSWRMYKKASIRKRCYADLNLRRSSWAVYHQNLLPYWVSRAVQRMWDVWRVRIPLSHFKEELISFFVQNLFANKTSFLLQILWVRPVVYLPALISQGEIPLCLCFADNHLISFHSIHIFRAIISIHCFRHFAHHHNVWSYFYYLLHENKI